MSELKEYIVTLKNRDDLDNFYDDMETPGGSLYIPNRVVECVNRRDISRNTHYMLSDQEVEELKKDARVAAVELTPEQRGIVVRPSFIQTSTAWNKSTAVSVGHKNWGLLRCAEGQQRPGWGSGGSVTSQIATIQVNAEGRNVDVVIVDGHFNPNHPEYAVNSDGTGGSRVVLYNWFQWKNIVQGGGLGNYDYDFSNTSSAKMSDDNHGAHVAGTACGNRQGWARKANIYNINPYSTNPNGNIPLYVFDYIRKFHANKPVNPVTGRRNPTITNNSWGFSYAVPTSTITSITYRGATLNAPFTNQQLLQRGLFASGGSVYFPARVLAMEADLEDAYLDGIINICAAGNDSVTMDGIGGNDFNNVFSTADGDYYYNEGGSPQTAYTETGTGPWSGYDTTVISVGSVGIDSVERKSSFSNRGPLVDVYAPGSAIISSLNMTGILDERSTSLGTNYYIGKYSGTSMASPQVAGVLACALEVYPWMKFNDARNYLFSICKSNQLSNDNSVTSFYSLDGSTNRYLAYKKERPDSGGVFPKNTHWIRPSSGAVWPRTKKRKYG